MLYKSNGGLQQEEGIVQIGNASNRTILMAAVPAGVQGRFFGTMATIQNTVMGASMLMAGFLLWADDARI